MKDCPLLRKKLKKIYKVGISTFVTGDVSLVFRASAVLKAQFPGQPRLLEAPGFSHGEYITESIVEYLREQSIKATATCSYASSWFEKNREKVSDIISSNQSEQDVACRIDGKK